MNLKLCAIGAALSCGAASFAQTDALRFNLENFSSQSQTMPDGSAVAYKAYEGIYYVANVEDSAYQSLNIFMPDRLANLTDMEYEWLYSCTNTGVRHLNADQIKISDELFRWIVKTLQTSQISK